VRREFQVQRGTLTFYGTPDNNPYADITASYNLKRRSQTDLTVTVHVVGSLLPNPSIELSSNENWLSTSDLISYLVTGQPTYALNQTDTKVVQQASSVLFPTLTAVGAEQLRKFVGSWVDNLQIQGGTSGVLDTAGTFRSYLAGARVGAEKQIANNLFVSLSTGLCSINKDYLNDQKYDALGGLISTLGGKIEYRFTPQLSLQALTDPPTSAIYCGRSSGVQGLSIIQTPRQYGFSLLRSWHF
jgi:translocation and assembly module TamB